MSHGPLRLRYVAAVSFAFLLPLESFADAPTGEPAMPPTRDGVGAGEVVEQGAGGEGRFGEVLGSREITLDVERFLTPGRHVGGMLLFGLFDGATYRGVTQRVIERSAGQFTLTGRLVEPSDGTFVLVARDGVVAANIRVASERAHYELRHLHAATYVIRRIDSAALPACAEPLKPPRPATPSSAESAPLACEDDGSQFDVLVVYTPLARAVMGGTEAMTLAIDLAVAESNTTYENSMINSRLRLVHASEIAYEESGSYEDHLDQLTDPLDGVMDEVHVLRDVYGADLVTLLVHDSRYCGMAWLIMDMSSDADRYGFSVVTDTCMASSLSFPHELGHNMGCAHDRANASVPGIYDYSYGYQEPNALFRTVMAYSCVGGCPRIPYFSNPDVTYEGVPTGVPITEPEAAHNALTVNNTALAVANFRRYDDCNGNGVCDDVDVAGGTSQDCNGNGVPDECEFDCNGNGVPDDCDIAGGASADCNGNGTPDECISMETDCNGNAVPDACDIAGHGSRDCNANGVPDDCEGDCNNNGMSDSCDAADGTSADANGNLFPDECEPPVLYVRAGAGGLRNGVSWADAFDDLGAALDVAARAQGFVKEIWVAAGTYVPTGRKDPSIPYTETFQLAPGVAVYGGFAGNEVRRDQRDPEAHLTILSGDLTGDDGSDFTNYFNNAWHVVTGSGTDETTVLDGFTITGGCAVGPRDEAPGVHDGYSAGGGMFIYDGSPTLIDLRFVRNLSSDWPAQAGGLAAWHNSSPVLYRCRFIENIARYAAGMMVDDYSNPVLVDCAFIGNTNRGGWCTGNAGGLGIGMMGEVTLISCLFSGNEAVSSAGALQLGMLAHVDAINCTFVGNSGTEQPGGIRLIFNDSSIDMENCILWNNVDTGGEAEESQISGGVITVGHSCVMGWTGALGGVGNFGDDPQFVDPAGPDGDPFIPFDNDLRLAPGSPCIDAGANNASNECRLDLDLNLRRWDDPATPDSGSGATPIVDIGAFEYGSEPGQDCNANALTDDCDISAGRSEDCTLDGVPDECEQDCNANGVADSCDIAEQVDTDCNLNGVPDGCDLASGTSVDANGNGTLDECDAAAPWPPDELNTPCLQDADCPSGSRCSALADFQFGVCYVPKNRYLSIAPRVDNFFETARRVGVETVDGPVMLGWVGPPNAANISRVVDAPHYAYWYGVGTVQVGDCEIAPGNTYFIQAIAAGADTGNEVNFSEGLSLATVGVWGDITGGILGDVATPPDDQVSFKDIMAIVRAFQGVGTMPIARVNLQLDAGIDIVNFEDITLDVRAFQGAAYPFSAPTACP